MFHGILYASLFFLSLSIFVSMFRLIKGHSMPDRILALDAVGYQIIGIVAILSVIMDSQAFTEIILIIGILAFLGTIALCKFIDGGEVIEHKRDD